MKKEFRWQIYFFHVDSKQQHKNGEKNIKLTAIYEKQDKPKKITTTATETKNKYNANSDIGVMTVSHQWYTKWLHCFISNIHSISYQCYTKRLWPENK